MLGGLLAGAILGLVASLVAMFSYNAMIGFFGSGMTLIEIDWTWIILGGTGLGAIVGLGYSASRKRYQPP